MTGITQLGYLGVGVSDGQAWKGLATNVLGLEVVPGDDRGNYYLRMDEYHHRIEVHEDGSDDIQFIGWEVPNAAALHVVAQRLEDAGVKVAAGTKDEVDARRVLDLIKCVDPSGIPTEIFCGAPVNQRPFQPTRSITGFKTGVGGLGHVVVYQSDLQASTRFYQDLLGFSVSDIVNQGGQPMAVFLHCNPRHHSIAFLAASGVPKRINHFMLECNSLDDVGSGRDLCMRGAAPVVIDLGRHMNDHMVSFYLGNPSQFAIEYGWGGREVDDATWQVQRYESVESVWGHPELLGLDTDGVQPPEAVVAAG
jgi:2,3-dihydroxybiphenyl 1,2-dioxygenase